MVASTLSVAHRSTFALIAADIKLAHSVFALPFALLGAFMAETGTSQGADGAHWLAFAGRLALIVLAMILARTVAMLANRWIDRKIDAANPRTANRTIPSGRLAASRAAWTMLLCAALFMLVCLAFGWLLGNWWPAILGLPVLAWISAYGYLKRFTALCHLYLGSSLALSPLAAAIAIDPRAVIEQPALWSLGGMVLCWVAGFDIIYALQDVEIDRAQRLFSIPARIGIPAGLWVSRLLHALAVLCLLALWALDRRFGAVFLAGIAIVIGILLYEHLTVARWGASRIALAFFTLNGIVSCVLGALGIADLLVL